MHTPAEAYAIANVTSKERILKQPLYHEHQRCTAKKIKDLREKSIVGSTSVISTLNPLGN